MIKITMTYNLKKSDGLNIKFYPLLNNYLFLVKLRGFDNE